LRSRIPYIAAAILAVVLVFNLTNTQGLNAAAPLLFTTTEGQEIDLSVSQGNVRLITFWSPSCSVCERDIQKLESLKSEFGEHAFEIISVAMPYAGEDEVARYIKEHNISYPVAMDTDSSISDGFPGVRFTPTTFLMNEQGSIIWRRTGGLKLQETSQLVENALRS